LKKPPFRPWPHILEASLIDRPNRFLVRCRLEKNIITAYLPNPGRLKELFLPDRRIYLVPNDPESGRKTAYTAVAVSHEGHPIVLHTHKTNDVARYLIEQNLITGLKGAEVIASEVTYGRSRFDFLLLHKGAQVVLEVKSCTLIKGKTAMFPDAVTERGSRHLRHLAALSRKGLKTAVLFVIHWPHARIFMPDFHTDPVFSQTLIECRKKINIRAVSVHWDQQLTLLPQAKALKIPWPLITKETKDLGSYLALFRLNKRQKVRIGKLGMITFPRGYYIYVGSAMANLSARIRRHIRVHKKQHWHLDYLRPYLSFIDAFPIRASSRLECRLAQALATASSWAVPGFGSSDCSCDSHLFGWRKNPLETERFFHLLLWFRMERLEGESAC